MAIVARFPKLETDRLDLRRFLPEDVADVARLCGEWEIAETTLNIPHPYELPMAEEWIGSHQKAFDDGEAVNFAISEKETGKLLGAISIHIQKGNRLAEIGYWIGKPYWNRGFATEATKAVIDYGFEQLELNRIQARHMTKNPASGRVMEKAGMKPEGIMRQSIFRWGVFEDAAIYSILREEYEYYSK
jgi:RimJ/RimL family protein N-acetyltransferase